MKHIVSYSGGMGSFAEAKSCVDKYGKENVLLLFADTLMEDEDLYRFLKETQEFLGCELVKLCYGKTPWELFEYTRFVGNSRVDICSSRLKRELLNTYIGDTFGYIKQVPETNFKGEVYFSKQGIPITKGVKHINAEVHLGIDYTESHRLKTTQEKMKPWVYRSTLVEEGRFIEKDFSEQFGIKRPKLYTLGFSHNNCGGFCVKAGLGHFKHLYEALPELYKFHEEKEQELKEKVNTKPFLRMTNNNKKRYISMKEFREEFIETGKADKYKFEIGGCSCALE